MNPRTSRIPLLLAVLSLALPALAEEPAGLPAFDPAVPSGPAFRLATAGAPPAAPRREYALSTTWPEGKTVALVYNSDGSRGTAAILSKGLLDENSDYDDINCAVSERMYLRRAAGRGCPRTGHPSAVMSAEFFMYITGSRSLGAPAQYFTLQEAMSAPTDPQLVRDAQERPWVNFIPRPRMSRELDRNSPDSPLHQRDRENDRAWRTRLGRDPRLAGLLERRDRVDDLDSCLSFGRPEAPRLNPPWLAIYCGDAFQGGLADEERACGSDGKNYIRCQLECVRQLPGLSPGDIVASGPSAPASYTPGPCPR